jgi:hypothetical protein
MTAIHYVGIKEGYAYDAESSQLILKLRRANYRFPIKLNVEISEVFERLGLEAAIKQADAVSCSYENEEDYNIHLFRKQKGIIGWINRKLSDINNINESETVREGSGGYFREVTEIPGYKEVATVKSRVN